jgi:uncharacterized RDD family membrane protein YckC
MTSVDAVSASTPAAGSTDVAYAGFGIRLGAYLIDLVILFVINVIAIFGVILLTRMLVQPEFAQETGLTVSRYVGALIGLVYFIYFWGRQGATPGKKVLKLRVRRRDTVSGDAGIGDGKAFLRLIGYAISGFLFFLPFLMILANRERRGLHDFLADTVVVRER